jgi:hypothetical protein
VQLVLRPDAFDSFDADERHSVKAYLRNASRREVEFNVINNAVQFITTLKAFATVPIDNALVRYADQPRGELKCCDCVVRAAW